LSIGQIHFATIQRIGDVEQFRQHQDAKPMVDQQNIQGQVEQRADILRHQVTSPQNSNRAEEEADARKEGKGKYSKRQGNRRRKMSQQQESSGIPKQSGGIDIKI
jgi:hypothetical protein